MPNEPLNPRTKYLRKIRSNKDGYSDVYDVLEAFQVHNPAIAHAVKKLLCGGLRGKGDKLQDYRESIIAVERGIRMVEGDEAKADSQTSKSPLAIEIERRINKAYFSENATPKEAPDTWTEDATHWTDPEDGKRYIRDAVLFDDTSSAYPECGGCHFSSVPAFATEGTRCEGCGSETPEIPFGWRPV